MSDKKIIKDDLQGSGEVVDCSFIPYSMRKEARDFPGRLATRILMLLSTAAIGATTFGPYSALQASSTVE